jgi:hypothetical protein
MPTIGIKLTVPDGTTVEITGLEDVDTPDQATQVERYWNYLSNNGRKVYSSAATYESYHGPGYTFAELAAAMSNIPDSVRSMHRTSGRSARKWRDDTGLPAPIQLEKTEDTPPHNSYRLTTGTVELIEELSGRP